MERDKVVVIVSGGVDSTTVLYKAVKDLGAENVLALSFDYGSNHNSRELPLAKKSCSKLGVSHQVAKLDFIKKTFKSGLLSGAQAIPEGCYTKNIQKQTVVPFRNGIMLSIAVGYAESVGAKEVWIGSHRGDRAQYRDCTEEFTQMFNLAAGLGTDAEIAVVSPFNKLLKWEIVKIGTELCVDYRDTYSCYKGEAKPCFRCGTCVERTEAFYSNNLVDPLCSSLSEWDVAVKLMKEALNCR